MKIVYVYADKPSEWNCSEWRCAVPARAINRNGRHEAEMLGIDDFAKNNSAAQKACQPADVIVVQRNLFGPVLAAIQHWKARDKIMIADFDDAYDLMTPDVANYSFWHQGLLPQPDGSVKKVEPSPLVQFKWGLRLVHAATVPSHRLADDWSRYVDIHYLPNYVDLTPYTSVKTNNHTGIIIGWGGSISHLQSFTDSGIARALKRVCQARPQVKVMICGNDRRILDRLPIPPQQLLYQPWVPYREWGNVLAQFDIGLAPLQGDYDERRSWIKILEYMLMKIPWVASEGPAYNELRDYGWLVKNNAQAWERVLMDMVDHIENYRLSAAGEPYLFALSKSIDENVDHIISTYSKVFETVYRHTRLPWVGV